MTNKSIYQLLKSKGVCEEAHPFLKRKSAKKALAECQRGDWILWAFAKLHPDKIRELTLAKAHCANTVRHLMKDERSRKAIDVAIAFGEGKVSRKELDAAAADAYAAAAAAVDSAADAAAYAASAVGYAVYAASAAAYAAADARVKNQKQTADICRKYLDFKL